MLKSAAKVLAAILLAFSCTKIRATGDFEPDSWLENGGQAIVQAPEFFWEIECKRIAREFVPPEKRLEPPPQTDFREAEIDHLRLYTAKMDVEDFAAAVKSGYVKTDNADEAIKAHWKARHVIHITQPPDDSGFSDLKSRPPPVVPSLPEEADSEFADYHQGAVAYWAGNYTEAKTAWEDLLKRPEAERKYRSTWAAFMLGKAALKQKDYQGAPKYFQMTRQLAHDGYPDPLGLAADSYGWEAQAEQYAGHLGKAARLYLMQLSAGDASAVSSLRDIVPDPPSANAEQADFDEAIEDPLMRRLITCNVLSHFGQGYGDDENKKNADIQTRWLGIMEKMGATDTVDAENLGWVAYTAGKYDEAARWLKLSTGKTPAACWLRAKLALRHGKTAEAARALSEAVRGLKEDESLENSSYSGHNELPYTSTRGDFGFVLLSRGDFIQALDAFREAGLWLDAAYVAERCLTTKELVRYAREHFSDEKMAALPPLKDDPNAESGEQQEFRQFRSLVARRLVQEERYKEARPWFESVMQAVLDDYAASLAKGNNAKMPKKERAHALFHAACIARHDGMELMGTEIAPDNASEDGSRYNTTDLAMVRLTGKAHPIEDRDEVDASKAVSFALPVSAAEKARLAATRLNPELRFHYRSVAANLAWKAAALLPDDAEETADVLNAAGSWLKDKHEKEADRFYQAIESRCFKTEIGKEVLSRHWFVEPQGPWSAGEAAVDKAKEDAALKKAEAEAAQRAAEGAQAKEGAAK